MFRRRLSKVIMNEFTQHTSPKKNLEVVLWRVEEEEKKKKKSYILQRNPTFSDHSQEGSHQQINTFEQLVLQES